MPPEHSQHHPSAETACRAAQEPELQEEEGAEGMHAAHHCQLMCSCSLLLQAAVAALSVTHE